MHIYTAKFGPGIVLLLTLLLPMTACGYSGKALEGKVIDVATNQPIPNAIVVVTWPGQADAGGVDTRTICVHAMSTVTDAQGRFSFPAWHKPGGGIGAKLNPHKRAYKSGYQELREQIHPDIKMQPFTGDRKARFEFLKSIPKSIGCYGAGKSRNSLFLLEKAVYEEAKTLAQTPDEIKSVQWLREIAASDAVAIDGIQSGEAHDARIKEFLQDHLK